MDEEDPRITRAKAMIGECFRQMLDRHPEMNKRKLARLAAEAHLDGGKNRSYVHEISKGVANPTIETLAGLASLCGEEFDDFLTGLPRESAPPGMNVADIPQLHRTVYSLIKDILKTSTNAQILNLRGTLEAYRSLARGSPHPTKGRETDLKEGTRTGSPKHKKQNAS